jgi:hypothetical protein
MTTSTKKPTTIFWIIASVLLLWNLSGIMAYVTQMTISDEALALLPTNEQLYYANVPFWVTAAFAVAVFAGTLGCIALLFRKKWAITLFIISLVGVLAQFIHNVFIQEFMEIVFKQLLWSFAIIAIAVFLIWFSKKANEKGWIF